MICKTKGNLKRPDEGGVFWKYLLWLWVWSRLTNWYSSTSDSSGMSVLITESIYWTKTRVSQLISWGIFSIKKICGYQVMATTSNLKFDSIKEIFDLSNGMFLTLNNKFHQSVKSSFKMNCCHWGILTHASKKWSLPSIFMIVNTFNNIPRSGQCKSSAKL